jgi:cell division protein FtsI/penicillin-binding protein 2
MAHEVVWRKVRYFALFTVALFAVRPGRAAFPQDAWKQSLRQHVERVMDRRRGAAVVLDVVNGKLLAASSLDLAARQLAAPGSTVKPFLLMALIDSGKLPADARLVCPVHLTVGGRNLDCTHPPSREALDARRALAWSCNNWFVTMAQRLEVEDVRAAYERAGFSSATGLVAGEATGHLNEIHSQEDSELQAIGAANIEITPLALAAAYRRLALLRRDAASAEKYTAVFQGLEDSVAFGTSRGAQAPEFLPSAGKTGTAGSGVGWTHAWFAGYWPAAAPQVVVVVFLERGRGGADAAPLARDIISFYARTAPR